MGIYDLILDKKCHTAARTHFYPFYYFGDLRIYHRKAITKS